MATSTSSSIHIRKRPYQPSITSFFNQRDATMAGQISRSPLSPPLPAETQASLLSVGMRVRKSVPEGYKTHKTLGTNGVPFPSTAPAASTTSSRALYGGGGGGGGGARELQPFCGLHKTGGWAAQEPGQGWVPPSSAPETMIGELVPDEDGVPGLSMSQSTIASTQDSFMSTSSSTVAGANKKRCYEEEIEGDMDAYFDEVEADDERVTARVIAKPRLGLRKGFTDAVLAAEGEDFEDANFLAPMDVDGV